VICSILSRGTSNFFEYSNPSFIQQDVEDISYTKRTRIYRGIYRLMIYGNLFRYDQTISGHNRADRFDTLEQSHPFLRPFPAWQVEELSCINYFIYDKITEKWREVEGHFYNLLKDDPSHLAGTSIGKIHVAGAGRLSLSSRIQRNSMGTSSGKSISPHSVYKTYAGSSLARAMAECISYRRIRNAQQNHF